MADRGACVAQLVEQTLSFVSVRVVRSNPVSGSTPGGEPAQDLLSLCPNPYPLAPVFSLKYKRKKKRQTWKQ